MNLQHIDAVDRADHHAEVASDAMRFIDHEIECAVGAGDSIDALVSRVFTGDVALVAVDAALLIDPGDDLVVEVEVFPRRDGRATICR